MSPATNQDPPLRATLQGGSAMTQGLSKGGSELQNQSPMTPGGPVLAALSVGSEEPGALRKEWLGRQAEFWQAMLEQAAAEAGKKWAASPADEQAFHAPVRDDKPKSDYGRQTRRINPNSLKSMADVAPVTQGPAKDNVRTPTRQVADAMAPSPPTPSDFLVRNREALLSNYLKIRDKLQSGDIVVACKGNMKSIKGFLSLLVRVVTASSYSHVGIVIKLGNRCFVVEATPPVVRLYPLSKLDSFYVIKMDQNLSRDDENRLFDYVGLPYSDWNSIVSYCTRRPVVNGKLQCAQLVSSFYNWPNLLRPEQIVRYAQEDLGKRMVFVR